MIRTLLILTAVSFIVAMVCLAAAFAIVGGPFWIDNNGQFHRADFSDVSVVRRIPAPRQCHT
ncbi:MAG TPA: hypothetical protein VIC25_06495 [Caulobacteraceae bacterium]|jgi:hypothetical protein